MEYECKYFWEEPNKTEFELFCESLIRLGKIEYKPSIKMNLNFDITFESQENYDEFVNRHLSKMNAVLNDFFRN